jgi:hypothetical protein
MPGSFGASCFANAQARSAQADQSDRERKPRRLFGDIRIAGQGAASVKPVPRGLEIVGLQRKLRGQEFEQKVFFRAAGCTASRLALSRNRLFRAATGAGAERETETKARVTPRAAQHRRAPSCNDPTPIPPWNCMTNAPCLGL